MALKLFLYAHIAAGGTALLSGLVAILTTKGGKVHKRSGLVFFYCMLLVAFSAFVIAIAKGNGFLLAIAMFSFYLNYFGYRALKNRDAKFKWFDWAVVLFSSGTALYMLYTRQIVLVAFGTLLLYLLFNAIRPQLMGEEKIKEARRRRVLAHLGNMMGSYIATVTAFVVVNINFVKPGWIVWLLPTALGLPVIIYYTSVWKKKLKLD
ncbi:MAG TPA: hypothetical protein VK154_13805 [Chitinophagales bacterium]|nr:hypothetical protein [Chitinophagales bacterium]